MREEHDRRTATRVKLVALLVALALLALAWAFTPLGAWISSERLAAAAAWFDATPAGPLLIVAGILVLSLLMVPLSLLVFQAGLLFGPLLGFAYAFAGAMLSALAAFAIGRRLGRDAVHWIAGRRMQRLSQHLVRQGVLTIALVRLLPIAPFTVVSVVAGAARIRLGDFMIGTALSLPPGLLLTSVLGDRLAATLREPTPGNSLLFAGITLLIVVSGGLIVRRLNRWAGPADEPESGEP